MTKRKFDEIVKLLKKEENKTFEGKYSWVYKKDNVTYRVEEEGYTEVIVIGDKCWTKNFKGEMKLSYLGK